SFCCAINTSRSTCGSTTGEICLSCSCFTIYIATIVMKLNNTSEAQTHFLLLNHKYEIIRENINDSNVTVTENIIEAFMFQPICFVIKYDCKNKITNMQ